MNLALYQPDIAPNVGAMLRLAACLGVAVDLIEPCGFPVDDRRLRRAGMDYIDHVRLVRHSSWEAFQRDRRAGRLILLTTGGDHVFPQVAFRRDDTLLVGRESAGAPADVHAAADLRLRLPMRPGLRSLNVTLAAAMVLSEALRQTDGYAALT
ncbi:tRNA (cytidine(34)-2'-O)-methyltransferase [Vineibacter terrae]|uniref:tRNA (cytidine(34)-2'-O)-methyltransferase n=1 Tax=Vineibacter terrae TaxID=2586908 RepID=UPI002E32792C|nr:tRNA (cytidine(34)-2'-O)-methyltransferase [Vineibacter terrae]HEX2891200.1 tRNA (cytidine(34)-2'-O)-methyltransferase [Vineibacter terrae]